MLGCGWHPARPAGAPRASCRGSRAHASHATVPEPVLQEFGRDGLLSEIGREHVFGDTDNVIKAYKSQVLGEGRGLKRLPRLDPRLDGAERDLMGGTDAAPVFVAAGRSGAAPIPEL